MHFIVPLDSAGLSRLLASSVPPDAAPAPISVDLVDEQDGARLLLELLEHALEALFEVAAVLGARQQRAHVQRVDDRVREDFGHVVLRDAPGQALGDGRLAHAGLADQQRVVLAAAAQHLDDALDLVLAADQRIDLAVARHLVEVLRELVQRGTLALAALVLLGLLAGGLAAGLGWLWRIRLLDAVGDVVDDVQARDALLVQVVHGMRILLAEDRHEHVGAGDFLLAAAGGLHVHDRALDHALEAQRRLGVDLFGAAHGGRVLADEGGQALPQVLDVGRAGAQDLGRRGVVQQREQQVLDGDELVPLLTRLDKRHVQADFQFLRNHAASIMH
jgi:hypothetical protein